MARGLKTPQNQNRTGVLFKIPSSTLVCTREAASMSCPFLSVSSTRLVSIYRVLTFNQFRVFSRQNPQIDIGPVDASVAMTISDLNHPDHPIIYASDPFYELTGFSREEVLGKNALFLQAPLSRQHLQDTPITENDLSGIQTMQQAMQKHFECQLEISSFKKSGQRFKNVISIIPVYIPETGARYAVGLNVEDM